MAGAEPTPRPGGQQWLRERTVPGLRPWTFASANMPEAGPAALAAQLHTAGIAAKAGAGRARAGAEVIGHPGWIGDGCPSTVLRRR